MTEGNAAVTVVCPRCQTSCVATAAAESSASDVYFAQKNANSKHKKAASAAKK